jgi:hypothetical protein
MATLQKGLTRLICAFRIRIGSIFKLVTGSYSVADPDPEWVENPDPGSG